MPIRVGSEGFVSAVVCWVLLSSCSVYDEYLLETDTRGITGGGSRESGASGKKAGSDSDNGDIGGTGGSSGRNDSGSGDVSGSDEFPSTRTDSGVAPDSDAGDICGDGRVTQSENCDVGISSDAPGACPTECPESNGCVQWQLVGADCKAECQLITPGCENGDNCCPVECTNANDTDCSASCGDGVVQVDEGEVCEPRSALAGNPDADAIACPMQCEDDGDLCTTEIFSGSEDNCNAVCSKVEITSIAEGDECCPNGANANTDSDCKPVCGNRVREGDEECDGAESCDDQCNSTLTPEQLTCLDIDTIHQDDCKQCICTNCESQTLLCLNSGNAAVDEQCVKVVECGERTSCVGAYCYCGTALVPLTQTCLIGVPDGPCKTEIEEAAGSTNITLIFAQERDPNTAIGRALSFSDCYQLNCTDICRPTP